MSDVIKDASLDALAMQRRTVLKGTAGILAAGMFPAVHAQEKIVLRYLGTCDGNMDEGSMRADVNVSVRKAGESFRSLDFMVHTRLMFSHVILQIFLGTLVPLGLLAANQLWRFSEARRKAIQV